MTIATSIGSVVTERLIDFGCLLLLIMVALLVDYTVINDALVSIFADTGKSASPNLILWGALIAGIFGAVLLIVWRIYKERLMQNPWVLKLKDFLIELRDGLNSVKKIEKKTAFWVSTVVMWALYFLMSYVVVFAMPQTSHLGLGVGLSLLVMGGLGMSAPVQGGFGTYHFLVTAVLIVYGVSEDDGLFFATLLHTSQTVSVIVVGSISFFLTMVISKNRKVEDQPQQTPEFSAEN